MLLFHFDEQIAAEDTQPFALVYEHNRDEGRAVVTRLSDGGYVVVATKGTEIFAQRYQADGTALGLAQRLVANGGEPAVTALATGGYALVWTATDASLNGIYLRTFDAAGLPTGAIVPVNESTFGNQSQPVIQQLADGNLAIAWTDNGTNGIGNIAARVFTPGGAAVTGTFAITADGFISSYDADLAALPGGGFAISYTGPATGSFVEANVRLVDAAYAVQPVSFSSRDTAPGPDFHDGYFSSVTVLKSGAMVVTWTDNSPGGTTVNGQLLDANGVATGAPFQIGGADQKSGQADVAALENGGFVVTWTLETNSNGTGDALTQFYNADGTVAWAGPAFAVDTFGSMRLPVVAEFGSGDLVYVFQQVSPSFDDRLFMRTYFSVTNGTAAGETIDGTGELDIIRGLGGDDVLAGLQGNDYIFGGDGNDTVNGNAGNDIIEGGAGDDTIEGGDGNDAIYAGRRISAAVQVDLAGTHALSGGAGDDTIIGGDGVDTIDGGEGNDQISGGAGADRIVGGAGDDSISGGLGDDWIEGGAGSDFLAGAEGNDILIGGQGGVTQFGDPRGNSLNGGTGDDGHYMGAQMTSLDENDGGVGNDQVALQGNYAGLTIGRRGLLNIEALVMLPGDDTRFGDTAGNFYSYNVTTVDDNVVANGRLSVNWNTLRAGENVTFNGSAETNGTFLTFAGLGSDTVIGGQRADGFFFGSNRWDASDRLLGGAGDDQLGLQGDYAGANALVFGADQLSGVEGIVVLSGSDSRFGGGAAVFSYTLTTHDANVTAGAALTINGNTLKAGESLNFNGSAETDGTLRIYGGEGNDTFVAGAGADQLFGGAGADTLTGGAGNDTFGYVSATHSTHGARDTIMDFTSGDVIALSIIDANSQTAALDAFTFIGGSAFHNVAGELRAENQGSGVWLVQGDVDGDGTADLWIEVRVTDAHELTAADFIL